MKQVLNKPILLTDSLDIIVQACKRNDLQSQEKLYRYSYLEMIKICHRYAGDMDGAGTIYSGFTV